MPAHCPNPAQVQFVLFYRQESSLMCGVWACVKDRIGMQQTSFKVNLISCLCFIKYDCQLIWMCLCCTQVSGLRKMATWPLQSATVSVASPLAHKLQSLLGHIACSPVRSGLWLQKQAFLLRRAGQRCSFDFTVATHTHTVYLLSFVIWYFKYFFVNLFSTFFSF